MSEKKKHSSQNGKTLILSTLLFVVLGVTFTLASALILALFLEKTGSPEKFYSIGRIVLLIIPSFLTGLIIKRKKGSASFVYILLYSVIFFLVLTVSSLFLNSAKFNVLSLIISFLLPFLSSLFASLIFKSKKKKHPRKKSR